jgi:hypothetical protein
MMMLKGLVLSITMLKLLLLFCLLPAATLDAQEHILVVRKGNQTVNRFWTGQFFAFQTSDEQWQKGELMRITPDSFYIRPMIVHYNFMYNDTVRLKVLGFALSDVHSMPKKGVLIDYKNGAYRISRSGGHVHFYWIKSGLLFRISGAGFAALHMANGLINDDFSIKDNRLKVAAGVFLAGVLMKMSYKPVIPMNKRNRVESFQVAGPSPS